MDSLHAQKENVGANVRGSVAGKMEFAGPDKFTTPKRGFMIHDDSKSTGKKGLKESSTKKSRRVLGDISNKQQRHNQGNASGVNSVKSNKPGKGLGNSKKLSGKKKTKTPLKSKAVTSLKPKTGIKPPQVEEVPDIEVAFGGLSSPKADAAAHLARLRDEFVRDIINNDTPTLFDDFDPTDGVVAWDDEWEKGMLESGEPPSPWWSSPDKNETADTEKEEDLSDLPPPDNLGGDAIVNFDDDGLLEDLLNVDVEATCTG